MPGPERLTLRQLIACNFEYVLSWVVALGGTYGVVLFLLVKREDPAFLCAGLAVLAYFGVYHFEQERLDRADLITAHLREQHKKAKGA